MVAKLARIVTASLVLVVLTNVRLAVCNGGSFWPFSSEKNASDTSTSRNTIPTTNVVSTTTQTQPSALGKIGDGTKNFFAKVTGKKPEPKKDNSLPVYPKDPRTIQDKSASGSWFTSWFKPEEKKPTNVRDYLKQTKRPEM
jgi:hypothetical protein